MSEQNGNPELENPHFLAPQTPSRTAIYKRAFAGTASDILTKLGLPSIRVARGDTYSVVGTPYREYDETFQGDSRAFVNDWSKKHPENRPAILELAGYGVAPDGLVRDLRKDGVNAFGVALAYEQPKDIYTPDATLLLGDLGELAIQKDQSQTLATLLETLQKNHCSLRASLIQLRPIIGYSDMEAAYLPPSDTGEGFYLRMFETISKHLLAPDGLFELQVPHKIKDKNEFRDNLQRLLGSNFVISPLQNSPYQKLWKLDNTSIAPAFSLSTMKIYRSDLT